MNISELFFKTASRLPDSVAIAHNTSRLSFHDFEKSVRSMAAHFKAKGLQPGDRVLVFVPMSIELYKVVMALFQIGATAVFLDEWVSLERLRICCRLADCSGFIAPWKFRILGFFIPEIRKIPLHFGLNGDNEEMCTEIFPAKPDDVALLTFTTGSTGTPKAASRSHGFLKRQFEALIEEIQPQEGDMVMTNLPIVMLVNFGTGAGSVIASFNTKKPAKFKPETTLALIQTTGVNVVIGSPYFMLRLAEYPDLSSKKGIQKIFTGGGPVFPDEAIKLSQAFSNAAVSIVYGSTEAEPISTATATALVEAHDLMQVEGLCVGEIFHRTSLKIIQIQTEAIKPEDFGAQVLKQGGIGEIVVAGDHVLRTYWNNEAAFRQNKIVAESGLVWHRTGDAGFIGPKGNLYLTGRCNQMIQRNGRWISPFIVEYLLRQIPGIALGTIVDRNGALTAIVQPRAGEDRDILGAAIRQTLPFDLDKVVFTNKLPRDPRHYSKIDYEGLKTVL